MSEPTISLRAIIKDETAAQLHAMAENVKRVTQAIGAGSSATVAFVQAEKSLTPAVKEATEAQTQAEIVIKRYKPSVDAATAATARQALTAEQSAAFARSQAAAIAETNRRMRESIPATQAKMSEEERLSNALANQIIKLKAQKEFLSDPVYRKSAEQAAMLKREVDKLNDGIQAGTKATEKHGVTWSEVVSKYYLASQAFGIVKSGLLSLVDAAKEYDSIRSRLNAAEGSAALGGQDFRAAQEMAKRPGLGFEQVATTMATLRGMKVTAGEAKQLILGIGQANASAAGSAEQFGRVMYQIQQSVSLGRLMAEDLRPIVQQIPTLGAAINNTFGTTDAEALNKRLKESGMSVREFWLSVADLGKNLPAAGETIQNNLDNISDGWARFKASITNTDAVKAATGALAAFLEKSSQVMEQFSDRRDVEREARVLAAVRAGPALPKGASEAQKFEYKYKGDVYYEEHKQELESLVRFRREAQAITQQYDKEEKEAAERKASDRKKADDARASQAKTASQSEDERIAKHRQASAANVEFTRPNEVTMRDGMSWNAGRTGITGGDEEAAKGRDRLEKGREKAEQKRVADAKKLHDEVQRISEKNLADNQKLEANANKIRMDWESALLEKKRSAHEEEMKLIRERADVGQKLASDQVYVVLQGEFTKQGALNATKDVAFRAIADTTTKWIEEQILKMVFAKSAEAASTTASVAQAAVVASAWAPASMATSIGTFGASTAAGSASWFTAMTAAQGYGMMPHERGGMMFGTGLKQREEAWAPLVPSRITPIHNSSTVNHNTTNAQRITIVTGLSESGLHRALAKVGINGTRSSRG